MAQRTDNTAHLPPTLPTQHLRDIESALIEPQSIQDHLDQHAYSEDDNFESSSDDSFAIDPHGAPGTNTENDKLLHISSGPGVAILWMLINTLATIGIVFVNKNIFSDPAWKLCQLTFASFHFVVTWLTLYVLSRSRLGFFTPRRASIKHLIPLATAMCLNVILPNLSLAFSSVTFYQIARILLTPTVAVLNYFLYGASLPPKAIASLLPICLGVGMVTYFDSLPTRDSNIEASSPFGVIFAILGVFASSLYTIWIGSYHKKLQMSSMQLLYCQAPISSFMLLYAIPFVDHFPEWTRVSPHRWLMVLLSGMFASLINISQFFIVAQTGPVSSTVVGHVKTCSIVAIGWSTSGRSANDKSIFGVVSAIAGIIAYSIAMLKSRTRSEKG